MADPPCDKIAVAYSTGNVTLTALGLSFLFVPGMGTAVDSAYSENFNPVSLSNGRSVLNS